MRRPLRARGAVYVWATTAVGVPVLIGTAIIDYLHGAAWLAMVKILAAALGVLNLVVLHWRRSVALAENALLLLLLPLLVATFYGSIDQTGPYWLCVFPVIAFSLKGVRGGTLWSAVILGVVLLLGLLAASGLVAAPISVAAVLLLCLSLAVLIALLAIAQSMAADAETRLEQRTAQLGKEVLERLSVEQTLRRTEEKLRFMAQRDALTGLPTRALLYDRLEQALRLVDRVGGRLGLLIVDVDRFEAINRRFGHAAGDQLLAEIACRLRQALAPLDSVARIGGDEFAVLAWDVDATGLQAMERQLLERLRAPYRIAGRSAVLEFSSGRALLAPGYDVDGTLREAEHNLVASRAAAL